MRHLDNEHVKNYLHVINSLLYWLQTMIFYTQKGRNV